MAPAIEPSQRVESPFRTLRFDLWLGTEPIGKIVRFHRPRTDLVLISKPAAKISIATAVTTEGEGICIFGHRRGRILTDGAQGGWGQDVDPSLLLAGFAVSLFFSVSFGEGAESSFWRFL